LSFAAQLRYRCSWCVYPFHFGGRLTVGKQSTGGYTTYPSKHNWYVSELQM
jgi:hypothetical protein